MVVNEIVPLDSEDLCKSRRLAFVPRWVVVPTTRTQNVAEHSYHVAQTARWLLSFHRPYPDVADQKNFELKVICEALDHDLNEAVYGDQPSPSKTHSEVEPMQSTVVVKVADILEQLAFVNEQKKMGNVEAMAYPEAYLKNQLHTMWGYFRWFDDSESKKNKPLTSDLLNHYLKLVTPGRHPLEEAIK